MGQEKNQLFCKNAIVTDDSKDGLLRHTFLTAKF
jgi:hypothetical protein